MINNRQPSGFKSFSLQLFLILSLLYSFLSPATVSAEEENIPLEEIIITATKMDESVRQTTSSVTVISAAEIQNMHVQFVPDVLRTISGIQLVQSGGTGTVATVLMRGGNSTHTLIMIDGVRVNSTNTGSFDFSGITAGDIERIEIVRGPQSTVYGSEAMSGVIHIITKKGEGKPKTDISLETGYAGTFHPSLTLAGNYKNADYRLTGDYVSTDGISAAKAANERDSYRNSTFSGKLGVRTSEQFGIEVTGRYYYDRTELDGFDFIQMQATDDLNFIQRGNHLLLSGKANIRLSPSWEQILTVSTTRESLKFKDPDTAFNNYEILTQATMLDWQHTLHLSDFCVLTAGAEYRDEKGENKGSFDREIDNRALYINNTLKLLKDDLILNAGLRYDDHDSFGYKTTYRIGALYSFKSISLRVKGSYGTGFRSPTFNELFFPFYGNVNLKPEESTAWEIGIEKDFMNDRCAVSLTYFDQEYRDLIQTDPLTFTAANIAKADIRGMEANAGIRITDAISLRAAYTYLDTKDRETGKQLTRRPQDKLSVAGAFHSDTISLLADYSFVSERYDVSVKRTLSSYALINLRGSYRLKQWLTVFARIQNLFDEDYEEAGGYGAPGLSMYSGIRITL